MSLRFKIYYLKFLNYLFHIKLTSNRKEIFYSYEFEILSNVHQIAAIEEKKFIFRHIYRSKLAANDMLRIMSRLN